MVGIAVLFDSNILMDYLNGIEAARAELQRYPNRAISAITWMEVMVGARSGQDVEVRAFLSTFVSIPITQAVAERAVAVGRERRLNLPDAIILATAQLAERLLVTRNTKDFPLGDPYVRVPYIL